jgi:hypothetical protein
MRKTSLRLLGASLVLAAAPLLSACGKSGGSQAGAAGAGAAGGPAKEVAPVAPQGAITVATRNTTRLGGGDAATDAAAVARLVYPGLTAATRPVAVVVVDARNWPAALAASALASAPLRAPLLYSEGNALPAVSREALEAMHPLGAPALGGAQVIRIGTSADLPHGYRARSLAAGEPAAAAAAIAALLLAAGGGHPARQAIVLPADAPAALQMPAAGLAAESGAPILLAGSGGVPAPTAAALARLKRPSIYTIDSSSLGARTLAELARLGRVTSIRGAGAGVAREAVSANSVSIARFTDGTFGWGVKEPGHGLVFANSARPLDAPAAALLSATGDYGPLLLMERPAPLPATLAGYLSNIQPAYTAAPQFRPVRGVYNRGWLIGDEGAISAATQAEIDALLEISPRRTREVTPE